MNIDTKAQHSYACFISVTRARRRQSWRECAFNLKALAIAVGGGGGGGGGVCGGTAAVRARCPGPHNISLGLLVPSPRRLWGLNSNFPLER